MGATRFGDDDGETELSTVIVRCSVLPALVEHLPCTLCGTCSLTIRVVDCGLGMVSMLETYCTACEEVLGKTNSSDRIGGSNATNKPFVVTRSVVTSTMDMGVGHGGLVKFCRYLDTPVMNKTTYQMQITEASKETVNDILCESAEIVRKVHHDLDPSIDASGVIDLTVSFDGSWMKRGHSSPYGIGCVIEVLTGLIIDFTVLSLYCQACVFAATRYGGKHTDEFKTWKDTHTDCNSNYEGSSGGMESEAAEILWTQSEDKHNFRYTTMLSECDSRTHKHSVEMRCVHVSINLDMFLHVELHCITIHRHS